MGSRIPEGGARHRKKTTPCGRKRHKKSRTRKVPGTAGSFLYFIGNS